MRYRVEMATERSAMQPHLLSRLRSRCLDGFCLAMLCNESSNIREGPASGRNWPVPWRYGCLALGPTFQTLMGPWMFDSPSWPLSELDALLDNSADFFRQLSVRRHFKWLLSWFSSTAHTNLWFSGCPIGVLTLRLFTVLISNDADRCIQMRDARMGLDLIHVPLADVVTSAWPAFRILGMLAEESRRVSFPLDNACDDLDSSSARRFRSRLAEALLEGSAIPKEAEDLLREPPPRCAIGTAAAHFALAAWSKSPEMLTTGQEILLQWTPLSRSLYPLLTTRWPLWQALDRSLRSPKHADAAPKRGAPLDLDLVFCGWAWPDAENQLRALGRRLKYRLHFLRAEAAACPEFFRAIGEYMEATFVLMLSPLLWSADGLDGALQALTELDLEQFPGEVFGFPSLDRSGRWSFGVQRLELRDFRLRYGAFPTGYGETWGDRCFKCDATSGTRLFRSSHWRRLVQNLRPTKSMRAETNVI
ncbi:unnamed protein product [Effrenium voratum]|uniref:Uncharacterized protein n=1 Tax=Effrenium voratum TaxID=2562239 RepID=A0AA36J9C7_9DINO|nr:unnamed protein product [Effrenium voratum]